MGSNIRKYGIRNEHFYNVQKEAVRLLGEGKSLCLRDGFGVQNGVKKGKVRAERNFLLTISARVCIIVDVELYNAEDPAGSEEYT